MAVLFIGSSDNMWHLRTISKFIQKKIRKAFDGNVEVPKQIARLLCHAFCSLNSLSTLRESYGKSKAQFRSGAPSGPWVLSAPACAKIPLWDVHVHFDCTQSVGRTFVSSES